MRNKSFSRLKHTRKIVLVNRMLCANVSRKSRELTWGHSWAVRCAVHIALRKQPLGWEEGESW